MNNAAFKALDFVWLRHRDNRGPKRLARIERINPKTFTVREYKPKTESWSDTFTVPPAAVIGPAHPEDVEIELAVPAVPSGPDLFECN